MKAPAVTVIDFETEGIQRRPHYPPVPVGFSIKNPGDKRSTYYGWGHPTENNCTREQARRVLKGAWTGDYPLLFQNGKFDVDVAETHLGMPRVMAEDIHDTLFLLFLNNPHADSLSLKPSAQELLGMPPEERDILKEWILANVPEAKRKPSEWGAYICRAPGKLVGRYADGDVLRTDKLFSFLYPRISEWDMLEAYQREQRLMPILLDSEREGIHVDVRRLRRDYGMYQQALGTADNWLRKELKAPDLNLDSDEDVGDFLHKRGIVTDWVYTKTGQRSVAKKNMTLDKFKNSKIAQVYGYRVRLSTCLGMFMEPWLEMAEASDGIIYTNWNQVRQAHGLEKTVGARTGRLSSSPNFQNIPKDFEDNNDGWTHPVWFRSLPHLPQMRSYLIPDPGHVWIKRDYAQQELRILAHFEGASLLDKYNSDPDYDMHDDVLHFLNDECNLSFNRSGTKILNFGDIYGMGVGEFARKARIDVKLAKKIKAMKRAMMPDFASLDDDIKNRGRSDFPIRTWGGRMYYCEEGHYVQKHRRWMTFEYKLLNYLIQGSAADCTKEAVIRYAAHPKRQARFLLTVHDECNSSSPKGRWREEMTVLKECMEGVEFACHMYSDGEQGLNWGLHGKDNPNGLREVEEKRVLIVPAELPFHEYPMPLRPGAKPKKDKRDKSGKLLVRRKSIVVRSKEAREFDRKMKATKRVLRDTQAIISGNKILGLRSKRTREGSFSMHRTTGDTGGMTYGKNRIIGDVNGKANGKGISRRKGNGQEGRTASHRVVVQPMARLRKVSSVLSVQAHHAAARA